MNWQNISRRIGGWGQVNSFSLSIFTEDALLRKISRKMFGHFLAATRICGSFLSTLLCSGPTLFDFKCFLYDSILINFDSLSAYRAIEPFLIPLLYFCNSNLATLRTS